MKHNIKTTNIFLTPAIVDYVEKRLSHLDKFITPEEESSVMCYVDIGKTTKHHKAGDYFRAELNLHIGGKALRAEAEMDDLYAAIDAVRDEMTREITSYKDKKQGLLKRGRAKIKQIIKRFYESEE